MHTNPTKPSGILTQLLALIISVVLLAVGFMFSVVVLAVVAVIGVVAFAFFWWKTRALRRELREQANRQGPPQDDWVIEGEAIVVDETDVAKPDHVAGSPSAAGRRQLP